MKRISLILGFSLLLAWAGLASAETIWDIQYTTDPGGASPLIGQEVTITGFVTAEGYAFGGAYYFVQDDDPPWAGIRVDDSDRAVAQNDEVQVTGTVAEVDGMTVIQNVTSFAIISIGNTLYDPMVINTGLIADETLEGCLMQVESVTVTIPGAGLEDFQVDDGSGVCWIGDEAEWYHWPEMGEAFDSIAGVVNYVDAEFKLEPRLTRDITLPGRVRTLQWVQQVRYSDLMILEDQSYALDDTVEVVGLVTCPTGLCYAGSGVKFTYTDVHGGPWSGIMSYDQDPTTFPTLLIGDSVRVIGRIAEYLSPPSYMTELFITEPIEIPAMGIDIPEEPLLTTGDLRWPTTAEQWGTVMVKVQNAVVINNTYQYGEWGIDDGSGEIRVDDDSDSLSNPIYNFVRPPVGTMISEVRGWVYNHYGSYLPDSSTYKIEPLGESYITIGSGPPDILNVTRDPAVPQQADPVNLVCEITDNSVVLSAAVHYSVNGGAYQTADLAFSGGFYWEGEIPEAFTDDWIDFFITAEDDSGNVGMEPVDTTFEMFCYPVTAGDVLAIEDVQYTPWPSGNSPFNSYEVTIEGVVTGDTAFNNNWEAYALQDADAPWSGICVSWITEELYRDQGVQITGIVTEADPDYTYKWGGLTKLIDCSDVQVIGSGVATPLEVTTWDLSEANPEVESYEGVLVTVRNVEVTSANPYDWSINDGSGDCLMDDDASNLYEVLFGFVQAGSTFERITGVFVYSFGTYKIELRDEGDFEGFLGVEKDKPASAFDFSLEPNFPNPFNASTTISYTLPQVQPVKLIIYNLMGQQVRTLVNGVQTAGKHNTIWNGNDNFGQTVSSGVYIYRIKTGDFLEHHKMVLLK
ncbi:hypothetical protein CEE37_01790 [candidate division LCP-89 bacterium B3_LCP]|uniref:FlgD/Vpr Ig-like domain-containing protein n=1 Tax=candidate division LCP-89 bacterium B3_LCP TaxID=2012998 RepID=A0A532V5H7_UNCL8|nr:MAG: hypothetical protein CEE37_01790 [candidate division LCP-89 bacterium B3_LCP]